MVNPVLELLNNVVNLNLKKVAEPNNCLILEMEIKSKIQIFVDICKNIFHEDLTRKFNTKLITIYEYYIICGE